MGRRCNAMRFRGQLNLEAGATIWRGTTSDAPAMGHDDLLREGEAEAGAVLLGRVEEIEDFLALFGRNARALIADREAHEARVAGSQGDADGASVRHRL